MGLVQGYMNRTSDVGVMRQTQIRAVLKSVQDNSVMLCMFTEDGPYVLATLPRTLIIAGVGTLVQ